MRKWLIACALVLLAGGAAAAQMTKYTVTTTYDKQADFSTLRTYSWVAGGTLYSAVPPEPVVAAIDRELAALGYTKVTDRAGDMTVTYAVVTRMDVDEKAERPKGSSEWPTRSVSTLHVTLRDPATHTDLFRGRASAPIDTEGETLATMIDEQIARIFSEFPKRRAEDG